jgi:predicted permease
LVLGYSYWKRQLGANLAVVGTTLLVKGRQYEIIGIAPRGFRGIEPTDVDIWLPLFARGDGAGKAPTWHIPGTSFTLSLAARLKADRTAAQAAAELSSLYSAFLPVAYRLGTSGQFAAARDRYGRARIVLGPITAASGSDLRLTADARIAAWLVGVAFVLLAAAVANVAGLLVLRGISRHQELALRLALGVSRRRLALQLFTESAVVAVIGAAASAAIAIGSRDWVRAILSSPTSEAASGPFDLTVPAVAITSAIAATLVGALAPLWYYRSITLGTEALMPRAVRKRPPVLTAILVTQGALTVVLLAAAGLFLQSAHNARVHDVGLDRDHTVVVNVDFQGTNRSAADVASFFDRALQRVRTLPGVSNAALATDAPLRSVRAAGSLRLPGLAQVPKYPTGGPYVNAVTPGFFAATGMRMRDGRDFAEHERALVVNETMAKVYWPNERAVGQCVFRNADPACVPVVGVVADSHRFGLIENEVFLFYYVPLASDESASRTLLVRTPPGGARVEPSLRNLLLEMEPELPLLQMATLGDVLEPQMRSWKVGASVLSVFGSLAVMMTLIGLASAVAYDVSQRRTEFATRIALGATSARLLRGIVGRGLRDGVFSVAAGLGIVLALGSSVQHLFYRVSPQDPWVLLGVTGAVLLLCGMATMLPGWTISACDPARALRDK